jgi:hypothetical protein
MDFIERLDEVRSLSCLVSIIFLYRILEIRVYFCSHFRLLWFTPCHRAIFLVTKLATILAMESYFHGLEFFSPLVSLVYIELSSDCLIASIHFESEFLGLILNLATFQCIYMVVFLKNTYIHELSFCRECIYAIFI